MTPMVHIGCDPFGRLQAYDAATGRSRVEVLVWQEDDTPADLLKANYLPCCTYFQVAGVLHGLDPGSLRYVWVSPGASRLEG